MKIVSTQALRGPNYWSHSYPKLIQVKLDFTGTEIPSNETLANLYLRWQADVAGSYQVLGNHAVETLVQTIAQLALALQSMVGSDVSFTAFKPTKYTGVYNLVFEYAYEETGKQAAKSAVSIIQAALNNRAIDVAKELVVLKQLMEQERPIPQLQQLIAAAKVRNVPVIKADEGKPDQLGYGKNGIELVEATLSLNINELFPDGQDGRIPIIGITGSNGKTTTTRLIAHLIKESGFVVGFTTSDGIYINSIMVDEGDTTGPMSAETVLRSREVEVAVLETARGGIVRAGLGFDQCDIGVITNVQDDHLGISDIETLEDLARVKEVVVQAIKTGGYAVLNADNAYTVEIGKRALCKVAWFSTDATNVLLLEAIKQGNPAAYIQHEMVVLNINGNIIKVAPLTDVPITFAGKLGFMVQNTLGAVLAASLFGVKAEAIATGLKSFIPSAEQTPGRMNIFKVKNCHVLVDFAHNPDGFAGIRDFMQTITSPYKIGIIVGTGDRKEEDVRELGRLSAQMFDHILIHQVKFLRGKTAEALVALLVEGILSHNPQATWERVPDEVEPLGYALSIAKDDSYIVALSDVLVKPTQLIEQYQQELGKGV